MKKRYPLTLFSKVLVPIIYGCESPAALSSAYAIAGEGQVILAGVVYIPEGESISAAAMQAREVRKTMQCLEGRGNTRIYESVRVSHRPWEEICKLAQNESADIIVLEWPFHFDTLRISPVEALKHPPCDLAIASGPVPEAPESILIALRGGPYAELTLRVSLAISQTCQSKITSLHTVQTEPGQLQDAPYRGLEQVLENLPQVQQEIVHVEDPIQAILERAESHELVVIGATARPGFTENALGPVAQKIMASSPKGVIVVKTKRPLPRHMDSEIAGQTAISVLVDQWFAENTYHADEFADASYLLSLKQRRGMTISLALPALNEEETVGNVIEALKRPLMDEIPLLDEIVLVDSNSTDRTREIASSLGVPVYIHQELLPRYGLRQGKGEALWKSLYVTHGDIVIWIDTDIVNIHPRFVFGLLGPLLLKPDIQFVKGFYRRPLKVDDKIQAGGGGRVTELTARPLINLFYPEISGIVQPLSGEYGGRRSALEQLPFFSGYGVEIGLLIDIFDKYGLQAIAQVDLQERIHHNQTLESLSKMSFAIIQAVIRKLERRYGQSILEDVNKSMKLIHYESGRLSLDVEEIAEYERPPMILLEEYRKVFQD